MNSLQEAINTIPSDIQDKIITRLAEFSSFANKPESDWFCELCFCLLTANAKAKTALSLQANLSYNGFMHLPEKQLREEIKSHKHRFHNTKAARIVRARVYQDIKSTIQSHVNQKGERAAREWLVENVYGLGYKEASHFLRNTGHTNVAIIDRHILNLLEKHNLIKEQPKTLNKKMYLELEKKMNQLTKKMNMNHAHLDLTLWYLQTGQVLK